MKKIENREVQNPDRKGKNHNACRVNSKASAVAYI